MTFKKWNTYLGWSVFLIATIVYFVTAEPTVSLWDCGEYITAAYKLEVGHPPGAPLFMVLGRLFSFFAAPENVALWINRLSGLSSSLTILFMFWSITMFGKKILLNTRKELSSGDQIAVLASSFIGALAYTFSESFWFSAVEGEVYAMASLFTAVVFWAILKWDEEMATVQNGQLAANTYPDRWLLLIMFLLGLAIGVHLLGILVVPAIGFVIYFRYKKEVNVKGMLLTGILSVIVLGFIQEGVIPGSVAIASKFEVMFTNTLGMPFFAGTIFFFAAIVFTAVYLIRRARRTGNTLMYNITMGMIFLLIGYGSFAVIVIRSNANTPLDENDPENLVTLHAYLKREQYGSSPILFGPHWNSKVNPQTAYGDLSPFYIRRHVVVKNDVDIKGFKSEKAAKEHAKTLGGGAEVIEKYWETNVDSRKNQVPTFEQTVFFPRMYNNDDAGKVSRYKYWSGYDAKEDKGTELGSDGQRLPSFGENMTYFIRYQVNWMYFRYFMWNFSGRQNDIQGHGDQMRGNWKSGFSYIDDARLGEQGENSPYFTKDNPSNNSFFFLPLILGIIGLIFHFYRAPKDAFVLTLVFLFTGLAIVVYLNQKAYEPRERDYAYAGSFYFFAMWIGLGVLALYEAFVNFGKEEWKKIGIVAAAGLLFSIFLDFSSEVSYPNVMSWLTMAAIGGGALGLMYGLRKVLKSEKQGAIMAGVLGLAVPLIMGMQGWDDHDRSDRTFAHDLSYNYLESCGPNGILFTNGDNDTFPLWYMQEVEGVRTDVRVANLSLMQTDWYTDQMKMKAYESEPLPIKFREDQILRFAGATDVVYFLDFLSLSSASGDKDLIDRVIQMRVKSNPTEAAQALAALNVRMTSLVTGFTATDGQVIARLELLKRALTTDISDKLEVNIQSKFTAALELFSSIRSGAIKMESQEQIQTFQQTLKDFEASWDYTNIDEAMAFVRDDANMITTEGNRQMRFFPSSGFIVKVELENAIKSGVITKDQIPDCAKELRFSFDKQAIQREQVMILDILANNDWKRGIYFSSPGGGDVSMALYRKGILKQNGMNYEISPVVSQSSMVNQEEMYNNLLKKYHWGEMFKEGVLTDYYARRHTEQYRQYFEILSDDYLRQIQEAKQIKNLGPAYIAQLRERNQMAEANRLEKILKNSDKILKENNKKAIELIDFSLKVMPPKMVIDHGESRQGRQKFKLGGVEYQSIEDGSLQAYVTTYFMAGAKAKGNKLGLELAEQLESTINYYMTSNPKIAFNNENTEDLFAAMYAYFEISIASQDTENGDPTGPLAKRTKANLSAWYNKQLPAQYEKLKNAAIDNGESVRRSSVAGRYATMMFAVQDHLDAMAVTYGLKQDVAVPAQPGASPSGVDLNQLMQQQGN
jgi:hypothetical protein